MPDINRTTAVDLLTHYLRSPWEAAGLTWGGDNDAEVQSLVDALAGVAEVAADDAVRAHAENEPHLYPDGSSA